MAAKPYDRRNQGDGKGDGKVRFGARGLKRGVPKDQQARNQNPKPTDPNGPQSPGASLPDLSYLSDKQQAAVEKWLGGNYDPTKALNVQLFKARWQAASQEERRAMAKNLAGQWIEGGPTSKTLQGFHMEYIDALKGENQQKAKELQQRIEDYNQNFGGWATTEEAGAASLAYWTNFASTPEGQAHIAGTGMNVEDWVAGQTSTINAGVANYNQQSQYWSNVQQTAAALGQDVPGFKPPGWESTLASIRAGTAPVPQPGGGTYNMYPGVGADLAGLTPISTTQLLQNRRAAGLGRQHDQGGTGGAQTPTTGASLYPVTTPQLGSAHPSITGFDYNDMISEVF